MPKDDINYSFTENGIVYDFYDVFVPAENFRQPSLWVWGSSGYGRLGTNDTSPNRTTPVTTFAGGTTWKQISCGGNFTAAIKTDGTLWIWGRNNQGQLGIDESGTTTGRTTPVTTFTGGTNWKQVSCGDSHIAAIKTDGSLWLWGVNNTAQLGINNTANRSTPITTFAGGTTWKSVSAGAYNTAAIKTDGSLWVWGNNDVAQLGTNDTTNRLTPITTFAGGTNWKQVSCGDSHIAAIKTDGSLWLWGYALNGRLGTNDTTPNRTTPVTTFAGGTNWKQVSCGGQLTAAIKTDGTLWTWGVGNDGRLGTNSTASSNTPVTTFTGGTNWKQVDGGGNHTAAIKTDGTLWTWGRNIDAGQLGENSDKNRSIPVTTFAGGNNWKSASAGNIFTAAIQYQPDP